jgi:hypothetical protein
MLHRSITLPILLLLAAFPVSALALEKNPEPEMRCYDVRDLTNVAADRPAPAELLNIVIGPKWIANPPVNKVDNVAPTLTNIADLIRTRIRPDTWDPALGTTIEERGGLLVVMQSPEMHKLVAQLLNTFRAEHRPQVVVKALLAPAVELPRETYFDKAALHKLLGRKVNAEALATPRIVCFNTQRTHVVSGREFTYIRDYDVSGNAYDPDLGVGLEGYVFEVLPTLSTDRKSTQVEVKFMFSSNVSDKRNSVITLAAPIALAEDKKPPAVNKVDKPATPRISLAAQRISADVRTLQTHVVVPDGQWVLAGTMLNPDREAAEKFLLFFISAELADKTPRQRAMLKGEDLNPVKPVKNAGEF